MSPASSWPRILFPLWDSCDPPVASRPGAVYTSPWSKKPKFGWWHQSLSHLLPRWVFLPLMRRTRRDSTENNAAAPGCAVAVTVQRTCIHCEDSQQLLNKWLFPPARLWAHSLIAGNQPAGKLLTVQPSGQEQPRQQSWCFYLVSWKKLSRHTVQHWRGSDTSLQRSKLEVAFAPLHRAAMLLQVSRTSLKIPPAAPQIQWMVPISRQHDMATKALHFLQGAPETWNPQLPLFLQLAKTVCVSIQVLRRALELVGSQQLPGVRLLARHTLTTALPVEVTHSSPALGEHPRHWVCLVLDKTSAWWLSCTLEEATRFAKGDWNWIKSLLASLKS